MVKVFTKQKDGKIHLTEKELKEILDEAYWDGYRANNHSYVYTTPGWSRDWWSPYTWTSTGTATNVSLNTDPGATSNVTTLNADDINIKGSVTTDRITIK